MVVDLSGGLASFGSGGGNPEVFLAQVPGNPLSIALAGGSTVIGAGSGINVIYEMAAADMIPGQFNQILHLGGLGGISLVLPAADIANTSLAAVGGTLVSTNLNAGVVVGVSPTALQS